MVFKRFVFVFGFLMMMTLAGCQAQTIDAHALDAFLEDLELRHQFNGSVAVSKGGELVYKKSVGFIEPDKRNKVDENSQFRVGSITKTFTAVMVMKTVEMGLLSLDQTIESFFNGIPYADEITIGMLLQHRSGLMQPADHPELMQLRFKTLTRAQILETFQNRKSQFVPNATTQYNNLNYVLLTFILEDVFKQPYGELLKTIIVAPLRLQNTFYDDDKVVGNNPIVSFRYTGGRWKEQPKTDASILLGAGGIVSTATDLVKFIDALFHGDLVTSESLSIMKELRKRYGMGLTNRKFQDGVGLGHAGRIDGYNAIVLHFEEADLSYALVSNISNTKTEEISEGIWNILFGVNKETAIKTNLDQYEGIYVSEDGTIKIEIERVRNQLVAQMEDNRSYVLQFVKEDHFVVEAANATVIFDRKNNRVTLQRGTKHFEFKKRD